MKHTVRIEPIRPISYVCTDITYALVPGWSELISHQLKLTLILPSRFAEPRPLIVWLCGGAWMNMDRNIWIAEMKDYMEAGFIVASVDYRLSHQAIFPAPLQDVKSAIRFLRAHAKEYNIDPERVVVMGESAGGYLAAMTGATNGLKEFDVGEYLDYSSDVQVVVDFYGPTDLYELSSTNHTTNEMMDVASPESRLMGGEVLENIQLASKGNPMTYISNSCPPVMVLHGKEDYMVPLSQSELLYSSLQDNGIPSELMIIEGASHADEYFVHPQVKNAIIDFINKFL